MMDKSDALKHLDGRDVDAFCPERAKANIEPGRVRPRSFAVIVREAAVVAR
jgi:hypothetical protein